MRHERRPKTEAVLRSDAAGGDVHGVVRKQGNYLLDKIDQLP
jgi:hypothetical protein